MIPERKLSVALTFLFVFFRLILSHAQTNATGGSQFPAVPLNPGVLGQTTPTIQSNAAFGISRDSTNANLNGGKYQEYQSLCRLNEYDIVKFYNTEIKQKRIELLKEKIAGAGEDTTKLKFRLIKEYIDQDQPSAIKPIADTLKKQKLSDYENNFLNGLIFTAEKNYSAAISALNRALSENKSNVEALQLLGEIYMLVGNYYEAGTIYEDLNKISENAYLVQLCETTVLNSLNAEAEKICSQASTKFPDNPFPVIYKGISHREREEAKRALFAFQKAVGLKPTEMGYVCLAEAYFMKGSLTEAAENFKNGVDMVSRSVRAILGLAWTQLKLKNYSESVAAFKKACKINVKYEADLRKAVKVLVDEKSREIKLFTEAADSCGR